MSDEAKNNEQAAAGAPQDEQGVRPGEAAYGDVVDVAMEDLRAELEKMRGELDEARDRALRATAEMDNYRKRARREAEEERRYAALPLLLDLLGVMDNMERAIEAAEKNSEAAAVVEGVKLVAQQLEGVLGRHHCRKIAALGQPFDPNLHNAILQQPTPDSPPGTVVHVAQEGYQLHDRVVRPAQVIVSTAPPDSAEAASKS